MSKTAFIQKTGILFLVILPPLLLARFIFFNSVNVPFWDQWELVSVLENVNQGNFYINDFLHQHNEHRLLFPRILMVAVATMTAWDTRYELFISLGIAIISFLLLLKLLQTTSIRTKQPIPILLLPLLSLVWFSFVQQENWMWGWQIQWFLSVLGVLMALLGVANIQKKGATSWKNIALIGAGAVIAQYSLGNGVLLWPLVVGSLWYLRVPIKKQLLVLGVGLSSTIIYYIDYVDLSNEISPRTAVIEQPLNLIKYVLLYLGRPISYESKLAPIAGLVLVLLFFWALFFMFKFKKQRFQHLLPWSMLGFYALASALATGVSRLGLGIDQAYTSRYTTISSLFLIGVLMLIVFNLDSIRSKVKYPSTIILTSFFVLTLALVVNSNDGIKRARIQSQYLKNVKQCTRVETPNEACLTSAYPDKNIISPRLEYLKKIHWGGY